MLALQHNRPGEKPKGLKKWTLELDARGETSDVTALEGAPLAWTYVSWQLERKLRSLAVLITVIDEGGAPAPRSSPAADVLACLHDSAAVHAALIEILRWAAGPLQAEQLRTRSACPTAALDASDPAVAHAMLLVVAAALGLLARLLQAAHGGARCALHDALLAPGTATGVHCLGTCVLLHNEMAENSPYLSQPPPTRSHDVAMLELEVTIEPDVSMLLPLSP